MPAWGWVVVSLILSYIVFGWVPILFEFVVLPTGRILQRRPTLGPVLAGTYAFAGNALASVIFVAIILLGAIPFSPVALLVPAWIIYRNDFQRINRALDHLKFAPRDKASRSTGRLLVATQYARLVGDILGVSVAPTVLFNPNFAIALMSYLR